MENHHEQGRYRPARGVSRIMIVLYKAILYSALIFSLSYSAHLKAFQMQEFTVQDFTVLAQSDEVPANHCAKIDRDTIARRILKKFGGKLLRVRCNPNRPSTPVNVRLLTGDGKVRTIKMPSNKVPRLP